MPTPITRTNPPGLQVTIRRARADDAPAVWPLVRDFATSFNPAREAFDVVWQQLHNAPHTLLAVAEDADAGVIGYLLANTHPTFLDNGPVAWVEEVMVAESHRRTGVGKCLMTFAEDWARAQGAAYVALASRRAGSFYLALNYQDSAVFYKKALL